MDVSVQRPGRSRTGTLPACSVDTSRDPAFLTDLGFAWGQAVDVNDAGTVLVVAFTEGIMGRCKALLWDPNAGSLSPVGDAQPDGIYPQALTAGQVVLGNGRNRSGEAIACSSRAGGPWTRLGTPDGWYATAMNDVGDAAGSTPVEGFERPWLRRSTGDVVWLPYLEHHHCRPSSMTASNVMVGTAQTDHGTHALMWRPSN